MKLKETKDLVYKKGLAVVIVSTEETSGEYRTDWKTTLRLYFKSKNAINRASQILGYKLNKKRTVEQFEKGRNGFEVLLTGKDYLVLHTVFGFKGHIGRNGYLFKYHNDYTGKRIYERVNPKDIFKGIDEDTLNINLGSCADTHGTFKRYLESTIELINKGGIYYCPHIS